MNYRQMPLSQGQKSDLDKLFSTYSKRYEISPSQIQLLCEEKVDKRLDAWTIQDYLNLRHQHFWDILIELDAKKAGKELTPITPEDAERYAEVARKFTMQYDVSYYLEDTDE